MRSSLASTSSCIMAAACLGAWTLSALARQSGLPDRESLVVALRQAEDRRACYQLKSSITYHYEVNGAIDRRVVFTRLADGTGRLRREKWNETKGQPPEPHELSCWNGLESRADLRQVGTEADSPHIVGLAPKPAGNEFMDEVENVLGLGIGYHVSEMTPHIRPSNAISNPDTPIRVESISQDGKDLVRVRIDGPWGGKGNAYIYDFDPQRQWLVMGVEIRVYQSHEQHVADQSRYIMKYTTTKAEQIDGVWMPRQVELLTRSAETVAPDAAWTERAATLRLDAIDLHPDIHDSDFTFAIDGMPDKTAVIDTRLGISYELGVNLLYADGILHELDEPIRHEIDAHEMETLLASSRPLIDPALAGIDLKPVGGDALSWVGRVAGVAGAALVIAAGVTLFRRRAQVGG